MKRNAFTLIELLVVIAIIAILAAILFPVFAAAREKARQTQCASNEKQLGLAFLQYIQDYDECPPNGFSGLTTGGIAPGVNAGTGWAGQIYPYVKSVGVFGCPDDRTLSSKTTSASVSYAYNTGEAVTTMQSYTAATGTDVMWPTSKYGAPSNTVLLSEFWGPQVNFVNGETWLAGGQGDSPTAVPGASSMECSQGAACYIGSTGGFYYGLETGVVGGYYSGIRLYFNTDGSSANANTTGLHSGGSNWLFFDGHVKWLMGAKISSGGNNTVLGNCGNGTTIGANTQCGTYTGTYSIL